MRNKILGQRAARLALVGTLAATCFIACSNPHLSGGKLHFDQERYDRAEENFKLAIEKDPANGEAYMFLAMAQAEQDRPADAAANFAKALELAPRLQDDIVRNRNHYWTDRYNSALAFTDEAEGFQAKGDEAAAKEKFRAALVEFKKGIILNPDSTKTWMNMGATYFNLGHVDSALATFQKVHAMAPDNRDLNATLTSVYKDQGNRAFNQGLDANRNDDKAAAQKNYEAAIEFYNQAAEVGGADVELKQNRAGASWELSELAPERKDELLTNAVADYDAVLAEEPGNVDVLKNLANLQAIRGQNEKALELAARLVDIDPKKGEYHLMQGTFHQSLGNKTEMIGDIIISQTLDTGVVMPAADAKTAGEKYGTASGMLAQYRENGQPEEWRTYQDKGSTTYDVWFYWTRGRAFVFQGGKQIYDKRFAKYEGGTPSGEGE